MSPNPMKISSTYETQKNPFKKNSEKSLQTNQLKKMKKKKNQSLQENTPFTREENTEPMN